MRDENPKPSPSLLYSPPAPEALEAFARKVCQELGTDYTTRDVVDGFSTFLKVVADINVKYRNRSHSAGVVDNGD